MLLIGAGVASAASQGPDLGHLEETRDRPLFSPTRRKPPSVPVIVVPASVPVTEQPPNLQLSGIVVGSDRSIAIVRRGADAKLVSLEVGHQIDGWTVKAIRPREIEMQRGSRSVTMHLTPR